MAKSNHTKATLDLLKVLSFCVICAVLLAVTSSLMRGSQPYLNVAIAFFATLLLTGLYTRFDLRHLSEIGVLPGRKTPVRVLIGLLIGSLLVLVQFLVVIIDAHTVFTYSNNVRLSTPLFSFLLYFFAALREELAFRGYPLRTLNSSIGAVAAQAIVALVFIIEHLIGGMGWLQSILGPGIGALLFGVAALRSKGLALPFGLHFAWNFGQWMLGFKDQSGLLITVVDTGFEAHVELIGWIGYFVAMILGFTALYFWGRLQPK